MSRGSLKPRPEKTPVWAPRNPTRQPVHVTGSTGWLSEAIDPGLLIKLNVWFKSDFKRWPGNVSHERE